MNIKSETIKLIDSLKNTCRDYGMGNDGNEYKIITQVFLYKFLNDKFGHEIKKLSTKLANAEKWELEYKNMDKEERENLLDRLSPDIPKLEPEHLIYNLWNQQTKEDFDYLFDSTMIDIADKNIDIFSTKTTMKTKISLFEKLTQYVEDPGRRTLFARALVDKLAKFSFEEAFKENYDFFATIFEYLIRDYNTAGGGKYAEYYTPHAIATIMAKILVGNNEDLHNMEIYDPSAGTGTLLIALAHEVGEDKCTIFSQDISQKSSKMLKLNLILNNLVASLDNVIQGDTLVSPYHQSDDGNNLKQFNYVVSNPPFKMDFSDTRADVASQPARFWAGVPNIPKQKLDSMAIYTCFLQHVINSLKIDGKGAVVVPSGFLTDTGDIHSKIRNRIIEEKMLHAVVQMPTNVFANTNTSVSIIFLDKSRKNDKVVFVDASHMGTSEKINDNTRVVFSKSDEEKIINTILEQIEEKEFSKVVSVEEIIENDEMLKPGLYFDMNYVELENQKIDMVESKNIFIQKQKGLIEEFKRKYSRNIFIENFVKFNSKIDEKKVESEYGLIPESFELKELKDLLYDTIGGDWGKEIPTGKNTEKIYCIRGTDIPNINVYDYSSVPIRYCKGDSISSKKLEAGDIVIEISGGSPIQSTGRLCYIDSNLLNDLDAPVLCTNFCRILRFKDKEISRYVFDYLSLLYDRGYYFNLENNTTGIKNLLLNSFVQNIKVVIPKDRNIINNYYDSINEYVEKTITEILKKEV